MQQIAEGQYRIITNHGEFQIEPRGDGLHIRYQNDYGWGEWTIIRIEDLYTLVLEIGQKRLTGIAICLKPTGLGETTDE